MTDRHGIRPRGRRAAAGAAATAALVTGLSLGGGSGRIIAATGDPLGAGGEYHPVTPVRILDTREADLDHRPEGPAQPIVTSTDGSATFDVVIAGAPGLPEFAEASDGTDANVLAVAVNVTVIAPTHEGFLQAFGKDADAGIASIVNFKAGEVVPNSAILRPGTDGELTLRVQTPPGAGVADVAIDLFGWFSTANYDTNGARIVPTGPGRIFDSRETEGDGSPLGPGDEAILPIRGATDGDGNELVPDDESVTGVLVNLTGIDAQPGSKPTFLSALPVSAGAATPTTSNLNLVPGQVRAVMALVPVGPDGSIHVYNYDGDTHLAVDVVGYLRDGADPATREGRVIPLVAPYRALDTRSPQHGNRPLMSGQAETWSFADFIADVKVGDDPVGAQLGLLGNLTGTELGRHYATQQPHTFLTAYPPPAAGEPLVPLVSNLNLTEGQSVPNMALLRFGTAEKDSRCTEPVCVRFYNYDGSLHYLYDVSAVILADET